ncbi:MAG: hydantoinase/oxoprolinase family protein [Burkholderiales bacterium]|nr:hydantoinase/oxoprolinase family protein [Burkholderiales bacterium]
MASIGIDIGGTFTDVVAIDDDGTQRIAKLPSTRADPSAAVRTALARLLPQWGIDADRVTCFAHGTTVATNAVLERKGARLGLLATAGFEDVLEIGRQNRRQIYELLLKPETPAFLAPGARRRGVVEAVGPDGSVLTPLDPDSLGAAVDALVAAGVDAIAICFLYAFANPVHERAAADFIRARHPHLTVSLSSEVDPAFREYERTVVTAFDAYVKAGLDRYLGAMERDLAAAGVGAPLQIMQSRGGVCGARVARQRPIRLFLSGPAAGVVGARAAGRSAGHEDLITVDIGGTSCDIALIARGAPVIRPEGLLDGFRIRVPMVDVNSIGAGGGSIAWIDAGGGLRVGPQSAGAEPGPACYGRGGEEATVTDASIVLGYLDPQYFAGGTLRLDPDLAARAIERRVARPLGLSLREAALGIHRVLNAQMAEGIRLMSISRGMDPRRFSLMPFGGGGALHATALARELGMTTVVVPRHPGVLCAAGLLSAEIEHEAAAGFLARLDAADPEQILAACARLAAECASRMRDEGVAGDAAATTCYADVCYVGQAHYLEVPLAVHAPQDMLATLYDDFCARYDQVHGHHTRAPARFVNLRVVQRAPNRARQPAAAPRPGAAGANPAPRRARGILLAGVAEPMRAVVVDRDGLAPGDTLAGPAIVEQSDTTTLIEPGWSGRVAPDLSLILTRQP